MEQTANEPSCALPAPSSSPSASCSAFLLPEEGCESPLDFQPSPLMEERRASFLHSHPSPSSSVPHKGFEEESLVDVRNGKPCIDLNDFLPSAEAYTAPPSQTCDEAQHQMSTPSYESQAASPAQHYMLSQTAPLDEQPNTPSPSYTSFSDAVVEQQQQLQPPPALLSDVGGYSQSQLPVSFALPSSPFLSSTTVQHHHPQPSPALTLPLRHHSRVQPLPSSMSAIALPPSFVDQPSCPQPASFSDNHDTLSPSSYSPIASSSSSLKVAQEVSCGGCTCSDCLNSACTQQPLPTCLLPLSSASVSSSSSSMLMTNGTPQQSPILSPSLSPSSQVNALIAHQKPQQLPASTTIMSPPFYGAQHTMSDPSAYTSSPLGPMVTPPPLLSGPIQNSPYSSLIPSSYSPSSPPTMAVGSLETGPSMAASSSSSSPSVSTTFILSTPASFSSNASSSSGAATPSFTYASSAPASSMFHHHFPPRPEPHPPLSSSCYSSLSSPPSLASSTDSYAFSAVTTSSLTDIPKREQLSTTTTAAAAIAVAAASCSSPTSAFATTTTKVTTAATSTLSPATTLTLALSAIPAARSARVQQGHNLDVGSGLRFVKPQARRRRRASTRKRKSSVMAARKQFTSSSSPASSASSSSSLSTGLRKEEGEQGGRMMMEEEDEEKEGAERSLSPTPTPS